MDRYPSIGDHGLIGDLQTGALVTTDGTVDWFCCPRFDSPNVFASLLDADKGGHFRIAPDRDDYVSRQLYLPETAILITRFMTADGVGEVHDFMPVLTGRATDRHRLVRLLRVPRGTMRFAMDLQPRFGYGRRPHTVTVSDDGAMFESEGMGLTLHDAQADDVRPDRRARRRADRRAARAGRRRAQLGLPLHLDQGRVLLHLCAARPRLHRGRPPRSGPGCWTGSPSRPATGPDRSRSCTGSTDHPACPRSRWTISRAGGAPAPFASGTGRPTSSSSTSTARPWTGCSSATRTACRSATGGGGRSRTRSTGCASTGTSPTRGSGRPAAAARTSPTGGSRAGSHWTGRSGWPSGTAGQEGTFSLCTFWYVDALARAGRLEEAAMTFEKMHTYANHLQLYSEEIGLTGEQLGNFPQAFSHLSLINAAINLDYQLKHGAGQVTEVLGHN